MLIIINMKYRSQLQKELHEKKNEWDLLMAENTEEWEEYLLI